MEHPNTPENREKEEKGATKAVTLSLGQPITPEVLGRHFNDTWNEASWMKIEGLANALESHRAAFQQEKRILSGEASGQRC